MNYHKVSFYKTPPIDWEREIPDPTKAHKDDAGWDICLLKCIKREENISMWDTGIVAVPPPGHYFILYGRSSLYKSGVSLANGCPGIIDESYRGTIKVVLKEHKIPTFTLPFRGVQLILKKNINCPYTIKTITQEEHKKLIESTQRGDGGFGSTG